MHVNPRIAELLNGLNNPSLPGIDLSLDRMWQLLAALGNPQDALPPVIHLAGTNGKGSTQAFLRAIYQAAGYRVHAYTSPHLVTFNERIVLGGAVITDELLLPLLERVTAAARDIPVTFFEATTAAAFLAFSEHPADVVLLETGLGGRLDATNVVAKPIATILTPIALDHMEFLGNSIEAIAAEKAGILKPDVPCIVGAQSPEALPVIARIAYQKRVPLFVCGLGWNAGVTATGLRIILDTAQISLPFPSLAGAHQLHNTALAAVAAHAITALPVSPAALIEGVSHACWPGRLQKLVQGPLVDAWGARGAVYLDGAHNVQAALMLAEWIAAQETPVTLVCGMMARKDARAFFAPLAEHVTRVITVPIRGEACHTPEALADAARDMGIADARACHSVAEAAKELASAANGTLLVAGSLFLVGEVLKNHG